MDYLSLIKRPIEHEFDTFCQTFDESLTSREKLLSDVLDHIRQRGGKRMRPLLILLLAKVFGQPNEVTTNAAVGLELLHTASLVHDDVVDESAERRGQPSVNASFNNKMAVLVGDYILSTALFYISNTRNHRIIQNLATLGRVLASGEFLQLWNVHNKDISEDVYYDVISKKTAVLFESCAVVGALSVGASDDDVAKAVEFGHNLGMMFQIRDDIFDYYDSADIGKPSGKDLMEGKITLPLIYALNSTRNQQMMDKAMHLKNGSNDIGEIADLVQFTKDNGGIEYAEKRMLEFHDKTLSFLDTSVRDDSVKTALQTYIDYVIQRKK